MTKESAFYYGVVGTTNGYESYLWGNKKKRALPDNFFDISPLEAKASFGSELLSVKKLVNSTGDTVLVVTLYKAVYEIKTNRSATFYAAPVVLVNLTAKPQLVLSALRQLLTIIRTTSIKDDKFITDLSSCIQQINASPQNLTSVKECFDSTKEAVVDIGLSNPFLKTDKKPTYIYCPTQDEGICSALEVIFNSPVSQGCTDTYYVVSDEGFKQELASQLKISFVRHPKVAKAIYPPNETSPAIAEASEQKTVSSIKTKEHVLSQNGSMGRALNPVAVEQVRVIMEQEFAKKEQELKQAKQAFSRNKKTFWVTGGAFLLSVSAVSGLVLYQNYPGGGVGVISLKKQLVTEENKNKVLGTRIIELTQQITALSQQVTMLRDKGLNPHMGGANTEPSAPADNLAAQPVSSIPEIKQLAKKATNLASDAQASMERGDVTTARDEANGAIKSAQQVNFLIKGRNFKRMTRPMNEVIRIANSVLTEKSIVKPPPPKKNQKKNGAAADQEQNSPPIVVKENRDSSQLSVERNSSSNVPAVAPLAASPVLATSPLK